MKNKQKQKAKHGIKRLDLALLVCVTQTHTHTHIIFWFIFSHRKYNARNSKLRLMLRVAPPAATSIFLACAVCLSFALFVDGNFFNEIFNVLSMFYGYGFALSLLKFSMQFSPINDLTNGRAEYQI